MSITGKDLISADAFLMQRLKMNDERAMEQLFKQYYAKLYRFAYNMLRESQQAEDAVQEIMMNVWDKRQQIHVTESLNAYLFMAVRNHCLRTLSKNERKYWVDENMEDDSRLSINQVTEYLDAKELKGKISQAIELLPPKCAQVFKLSRFEDKSYKEIAELMDISVKTVENQMGKALMLMRKYLKPFLNQVIALLVVLFGN